MKANTMMFDGGVFGYPFPRRRRGGVPHVAKHQPSGKKVKGRNHLRDRSCRLRCSLRLKARLQYWHLYFFSGTEAVFLGVLLVAKVLAGSELVALSD